MGIIPLIRNPYIGLTPGAYTGTASAQDGLLWLRGPGALDRCPLWAPFAITVLVLLLSIEMGFQSEHAVSRRSESEQKWPLEEIEAATLSPLAFMPAVTFGLAASRFDARTALPIVPLAIALSAVMRLIADLYRSQQGLLSVSQQPWIDLQNAWGGSSGS